MARNRTHAARLLTGQEQAPLEASLPERATQLGDQDVRGPLRLRAQANAGDESRARMVAEAVVPLEKKQARRERPTEDRQAAPRSGRTGGLGSRAERPSEGGNGRSVVSPVEAGRSSKSPSTPSERRRRGSEG